MLINDLLCFNINQVILDLNNLIETTEDRLKLFNRNLYTTINQIILDKNNLLEVNNSLSECPRVEVHSW